MQHNITPYFFESPYASFLEGGNFFFNLLNSLDNNGFRQLATHDIDFFLGLICKYLLVEDITVVKNALFIMYQILHMELEKPLIPNAAVVEEMKEASEGLPDSEDFETIRKELSSLLVDYHLKD